MALPNDSFTTANGTVTPTHLIGGKEFQVVMVAGFDGHISKDRYTLVGYRMVKAASKVYVGIHNGTGSGRLVEVGLVKLQQISDAAIVGLSRGYALHRNTGISGGVQVVNAGLQRADTLSADPPAAVVARRDGLTVTGAPAEPLSVATLSEEETAGPGEEAILWNAERQGGGIILREGQGIHVVQDAIAGVGLLSAVIAFDVY